MSGDRFIEVFVGPEEVIFDVLPRQLVLHSKLLTDEVSSCMETLEERVAFLREEDPEVFKQFLDWGQCGVYRVAKTDGRGRAEHSMNETSRRDVPSREIGGEPTNLTRFYCTICKEYRCMPANVMIRWWCNACQLASYEPGNCSKCNSWLKKEQTFSTICESNGCRGEPLLKSDSRWAVVDGAHWHLFRQQFDSRTRYGVGPYTHSEIREIIDKKAPEVRKSFNFVAHAKVFVFAEKWEIAELQKLAVHLLHRDLTPCSPIDFYAVENLLDLVRYIYNHNDQEMGSEEVSPVKEVALEYMAINSIKLLQYESFCKLLHFVDEFAIEFAKVLAKHIF